MPEPGRVLTRPVVEQILARAKNGQRPFAEEARTLARSHEQLREAAEYVRDASLITADDAMLTDALEKLDVALSAGEETP